MRGFSPDLTELEKLILRAFHPDGTLVWPDTGLAVSATMELIQGLKERDYLTGSNPFRLTQKGRRWRRLDHDAHRAER